MATITFTITIEQEALRRFFERHPGGEDFDLTDAALVNHVYVRLTRRAKQRTVLIEGIPAVWVHYPTVADENWLLRLGPSQIKRRMRRLIQVGILVRQQVSLGPNRGSQSYYGISDAYKAMLQEIETVRRQKRPAFQGSSKTPTFQGARKTPGSHGGSQGVRGGRHWDLSKAVTREAGPIPLAASSGNKYARARG